MFRPVKPSCVSSLIELDSPLSQCCPPYPRGQSQLKEPHRLTHVPPFRHGLLLQKCLLAAHPEERRGNEMPVKCVCSEPFSLFRRSGREMEAAGGSINVAIGRRDHFTASSVPPLRAARYSHCCSERAGGKCLSTFTQVLYF